MKQKLTFWAALVVAAALATAILAPLQAMPFGRDQALLATGARVMSERGWSVEQCWYVRAPGAFLWMALAHGLVGPLEGDARTLEWVWMLVACLAAALAAYEWSRQSRWAAVLAASLLAVRYVGGGFGQTLEPSGLALLPLLLAMGLWGPIGRERSWVRSVMAGLLLGVATLFSGVAIWLALALAGSELLLAKRGQTLAKAHRDAMVFSGGVFVLPAAYFALTLAFVDWAYIKPTLGATIQNFATQPPLFAVDYFVLIVLGLFVWKQPSSRAAAVPLAAAIIVMGGVSLAFAEPTDRLIVFGPLAVAGAWCVIEGLRWFQEQQTPRYLRGIALVVFSLTLLLGGPWWNAVGQWRHFCRYLAGAYVTELAAVHNNAVTSYSYVGLREAAGQLERLRRHGNDRLLVWGAEPGLYHFSGMPPASRFLTHVPLLNDDADGALRAELESLLRDNPPEFVAVRFDDNNLPHLAGATDSRDALRHVPGLVASLAAHYRRVWTGFGFDLYAWTPPDPTAPAAITP